MRKTLISLIVCMFLISLISAVSAEIMISQPKSTYSIGENLDLSVKLSEGGKLLEAELICNNESKSILLKNLKPQETEVVIFQPLTKSLLGNLRGICNVLVRYNRETEKSQDFKISGSISITLTIANLNYNAGDKIIVRGEAKRENNELAEGFVEITLSGTSLKLINPVKQGKFSTNFSLPENLVSGRYTLKARVYEKDSQGEISNEGEETVIIGVKQEPKKLEVAINQQSITPGEQLTFKVLLYDQANLEMPGDASVIVKDSSKNEILKRLVKTEEEISLKIEENAPAGYWKIEASSLGISATRLFSVEESEKAEFSIVNDTLTITNIGNVVYRKAVQISIGGEVEIKELNLEVGESREFRLLAPDGSYSITVTDGTTTFTESEVPLTGNIIGVLDIKKQLSVWRKYPIVWLFLILVMGLFILMLIQRTVKRKVYAYPVEERKVRKREGVGKFLRAMEKSGYETGERLKAEHTLVLGGTKQTTALVCLKIKNKISKESEKNLEAAFGQAYELKAVSYKSGEYIFLIFSPLLTRTFKNYSPAVRAAEAIARAIRGYNSKFREKIDFGISVHAGELAGRIDREDKKLKFTAIGNTLGRAKRIADISNQEVLLSRELHEKTVAEVKAEKLTKDGQEVYRVQRITDTEKNKQFIKDFLKKMDEDAKRKTEKR